MSMIYNSGNVVLNRGDSLSMAIQLNIGTKLEPIIHKLTEHDAVYFGLMEPNQPFECALLKKKLTVENLDSRGNVQLNIRPRDTQCLLPGKYFYQIKLCINNEEVYTIVDKTQFFITE